MCLMPGGNVLIPPSERGRKICQYLKVALGLHFGLAIFLMVGGRYVDGVFDILGAFIGYYAIRNSEGYSLQCVLSYCVFCAMDVFWACLRLILHFSGASSTESGNLDGWQYHVFIAGLIISPFIYTYCTVTAYYLYKDLKLVMEDGMGGMGGEELGGGGMGGIYAAPRPAQPSGASWGHAESHPSGSAASSSSSGGFKPFSGTGNRLGGN